MRSLQTATTGRSNRLLDALMPLHASLEAGIKVGSLIELQKQVGDWQVATFPGQTVQGKIKHLIKEANELLDDPSDEVEMADVLILLIGIAKLQGVTVEHLVEVAWAKFERAKKRKWPTMPDADGVFHHTEEVA